MNADATEVMKNIGVNDVTGDMQMQQLDFQTRKLVEIAKVVMKQPQILVIDETSTALSHDGRQVLYDIMNRFRKENKSVIFISHDLDEIMDVCDTLTVLRDGKIIRTFVKEEFEAGAIRASMIGRELQGDYYRSDFKATSQPQVALDVKNLIYGDRLKDISFQVKKGEIVGIGGLAHCGMHSLGKVCFGALKPESGSVSVSDGTIIDSPSKAMKKRLGYVSKDRDVESLCLNASIEDNISIAGMSEFAIKDFLVLKNREKKYVDNQIKELSIKCAGREQSVSQLSGGNKQKVVFGKWIGCGSEIIILDCPTRGVDKVLACTYQAISGAGKTFKTWPEMVDNVIPYIGGEEEKSEQEPLKIWGKIEGDKIVKTDDISITSQCIRVPVSDGHTAAVFMSFKDGVKKPTVEEIIDIWSNYSGRAQELNLPSAPKHFLHYFTEPDRPQIKSERNLENGMAVSVGRLRPDTQYDYKFVCMSHNTLRGAAGGAVLLAELLCAEGYMD